MNGLDHMIQPTKPAHRHDAGEELWRERSDGYLSRPSRYQELIHAVGLTVAA